MINSLIIEDEFPNLRRLEKLLMESSYSINILAKLQTVKESILWLTKNESPSLIFMDVRLTDGLSFEIFKNVNVEAPVIFTTAYDEFALQAFKVNTIDYLLKPIDKAALEQSLNKFTRQTNNPDHKTLLQLLSQINLRRPVHRSRYLVNYRSTLISIAADEIAYFGSEFKSSFLVTHAGQKYFIDQTMEEIEHEVNPGLFFRVTRQYIICSKAIAKIHTYFNGRLRLELSPVVDEEIIVSRDKSNAFKDWLNK